MDWAHFTSKFLCQKVVKSMSNDAFARLVPRKVMEHKCSERELGIFFVCMLNKETDSDGFLSLRWN